MKFIKNNWLKLSLATICLLCSILLLIPSFMAETIDFVGACQSIGLILFFVGIMVVVSLKMLKKTKSFSKYVLILTGLASFVFLSIGMSGLSKTDANGVIGKSYAYFASVEDTVEAGEETLAAKQSELTAKTKELEQAKVDITALGLLAQGWNDVVPGYLTPGLFGTMVDGVFVLGVDSTQTKIENIVANPAITSESPYYATVIQLDTIKSQLIVAGLGGQTLSTAPYVMGGIVAASRQTFPQLEEAIAQLQGVIDMNAAELAAGKAQIKDANAAAATIKFLYISLMLGMGCAPILIGIKKLTAKKD